MPETPEFPPDEHITRDLDPRIERDDLGSTLTLPVVPELLDESGGLRAGVVGTVADIVCGEVALRRVVPGWMATSSMSLQLAKLPGDGTLRVRPRLLRHGRTTLVLEVAIDHVETERSCGLGILSFAILPKQTERQSRAMWAEEPAPVTTFANASSGFTKPLLETIGLQPDPDDTCVCHLQPVPYLGNTLGAMQGGVVSMLIDAAAERFGSSALGAPCRVAGLELHYLELARKGPVRATAREVGRLGSGITVRVELHDEGRDETLLTLGSVVLDRVDV